MARMANAAKTAGVILAAGRGERMRTPVPKVLHPVAGIPMVEHVVRAFRAAGVSRIVVVVGPDSAGVQEALKHLKVRFAVQRERRGTAHALAAARKALGAFTGELLVACGDTPLLAGETLGAFLAAHRSSGAAMSVGTFEVADPTGYGRVVMGPGRSIERIVEEREATPEEGRIRRVNSGVYCFTAPGVFRDLARVAPSAVKGELYLTETVRIAAGEGRVVAAWNASDPDAFRGVNTVGELADTARIMRERILARHMAAGVVVVDPASAWIDVDVSISPGTTIHPCTIIEKGVRIGRNCQVGPFARLRGATALADGAEIGNYVEVKSSRIGAGTKAKHLAYLGDGTIGPGVNIGAGTILANYDGKKKWPTAIGAGAFIGSGAILVAPVRIGAKALVGAGAVVTRGRNVPKGAVVVGVPAREIALAAGTPPAKGKRKKRVRR